MATKVEKRSERREKSNQAIDEKVKSKQGNYEESVESLKKGAPRWILFFIAIFLIWFCIKFQ